MVTIESFDLICVCLTSPFTFFGVVGDDFSDSVFFSFETVVEGGFGFKTIFLGTFLSTFFFSTASLVTTDSVLSLSTDFSWNLVVSFVESVFDLISFITAFSVILRFNFCGVVLVVGSIGKDRGPLSTSFSPTEPDLRSDLANSLLMIRCSLLADIFLVDLVTRVVCAADMDFVVQVECLRNSSCFNRSRPSNILCCGVLPGNRIRVILSSGFAGCQTSRAHMETRFCRGTRNSRLPVFEVPLNNLTS